MSRFLISKSRRTVVVKAKGHTFESCVQDVLKKEGGAAGLKAIEAYVKKMGHSTENLVERIKAVPGVSQHEHGDFVLVGVGKFNKAKSGEGSRGGNIIGHTRSGKPIYGQPSGSVPKVGDVLSFPSDRGQGMKYTVKQVKQSQFDPNRSNLFVEEDSERKGKRVVKMSVREWNRMKKEASSVEKAGDKPPAGYKPMKRSKHGGYVSADGKHTWYPSTGKTGRRFHERGYSSAQYAIRNKKLGDNHKEQMEDGDYALGYNRRKKEHHKTAAEGHRKEEQKHLEAAQQAYKNKDRYSAERHVEAQYRHKEAREHHDYLSLDTTQHTDQNLEEAARLSEQAKKESQYAERAIAAAKKEKEAMGKSVLNGLATLLKANKPPAGYRPMKRSKHGGWVNDKGQTWYPSDAHRKRDAQHVGEKPEAKTETKPKPNLRKQLEFSTGEESVLEHEMEAFKEYLSDDGYDQNEDEMGLAQYMDYAMSGQGYNKNDFVMFAKEMSAGLGFDDKKVISALERLGLPEMRKAHSRLSKLSRMMKAAELSPSDKFALMKIAQKKGYSAKNNKAKDGSVIKRLKDAGMISEREGKWQVTSKGADQVLADLKSKKKASGSKPPAGYRPMKRSKHGGWINDKGQTWYPSDAARKRDAKNVEAKPKATPEAKPQGKPEVNNRLAQNKLEESYLSEPSFKDMKAKRNTFNQQPPTDVKKFQASDVFSARDLFNAKGEDGFPKLKPEAVKRLKDMKVTQFAVEIEPRDNRSLAGTYIVDTEGRATVDRAVRVMPKFAAKMSGSVFNAPSRQMADLRAYEAALEDNDPPPVGSAYRKMAERFDIGVRELDDIADDLGYKNMPHMESSIGSPKRLVEDSGAEKFIAAVREYAYDAEKMSDKEILEAVGAEVPKSMQEEPKKFGGKKKSEEKRKTRAELIVEYKEAIKNSKMDPKAKEAAMKRAEKPGFDPQAALASMGEEEEEMGKSALNGLATLLKASKPPAGYRPMKRSKFGGWINDKGQTWYPSQLHRYRDKKHVGDTPEAKTEAKPKPKAAKGPVAEKFSKILAGVDRSSGGNYSDAALKDRGYLDFHPPTFLTNRNAFLGTPPILAHEEKVSLALDFAEGLAAGKEYSKDQLQEVVGEIMMFEERVYERQFRTSAGAKVSEQLEDMKLMQEIREALLETLPDATDERITKKRKMHERELAFHRKQQGRFERFMQRKSIGPVKKEDFGRQANQHKMVAGLHEGLLRGGVKYAPELIGALYTEGRDARQGVVFHDLRTKKPPGRDLPKEELREMVERAVDESGMDSEGRGNALRNLDLKVSEQLTLMLLTLGYSMQEIEEGVKKKADEPAEKKAEEPRRKKSKEKPKTKAELLVEYKKAIERSKMDAKAKQAALKRAEKPGFDPQAALASMREDEEGMGKSASFPYPAERLNAMVQKNSMPESEKEDDGVVVYEYESEAIAKSVYEQTLMQFATYYGIIPKGVELDGNRVKIAKNANNLQAVNPSYRG